MASHISRLSIRPEAPMRDPTVTSRALLRAKPSAASAHPEAELRRVMTMGMSPPPTWAARM